MSIQRQKGLVLLKQWSEYVFSQSCGVLTTISLATVLSILPVTHSSAAEPELSGQDALFLQAREAAKKGDRKQLDDLAPLLTGYPLDMYVEYWRLKPNLDKPEYEGQAQAFLKRTDGTYLGNRFRLDWLNVKGKNKEWAVFDAEYPHVEDTDQGLKCLALESQRARGDLSMQVEAKRLWNEEARLPRQCDAVLESLIWDKQVGADDVWNRIRVQIEEKQFADARQTMNYLPKSQTPSDKVAVQVTDKSASWLARANINEGRMTQELAALAVAIMARSNPSMAAAKLNEMSKVLPSNARQWAWGQVAYRAAWLHMDEAVRWYKLASDNVLSATNREWRVRAALRSQDWGLVEKSILSMPVEQQNEPSWTYWLARAYVAQGRQSDADPLLAQIAGKPDFYGNLADEELGHAIAPPPKAIEPTEEEIARIQANPSIQRALALFHIDQRYYGVREWNWALRGMSDRDLLAASEVALRAEVYDRAIVSANRTLHEHNYSLRYLAPFSNEVREAARQQSLDDAWVYGLMRQESRFVTSARSSVGASGLMQLMPKTARWVAKKIGLTDYDPRQVTDPETNLLLGTSYMRMVLESLDDHPVLASAAYNAGPGRARKWKADHELEGAVYAETIPFNETRDYVKKVMSNSVYYAALFGERPQSLKSRLGMIHGRGASDLQAETLP